MNLRTALELSLAGKTTGWLFLPKDFRQWNEKTEALFVDLDSLDSDPTTNEPILPEECLSRSLRETIDVDTIAECVKWADQLVGRQDPEVRLKSFIYYVRFDAPMPAVDADEPPPWEETQMILDREFYDKLGPEDSSHRCRHEGCGSGSVRFSFMCKRHHFEMIQKRECPFTH